MATQDPWNRPVESIDGPPTVAERTPDFDPTRYLIDLRGKEYLEVRYRLMWLEATCPHFSIYTHHIEITPQIAIFAATVSIHSSVVPDGDEYENRGAAVRSATAHGSETPGDFGDYIEKAETKAIGRALAMLGFGTQFAAEFTSEISDAPRPRPVDTPTQQRPQVQRGNTPTGPENPMREGNWNRTGTPGPTWNRGQMGDRGVMQNPEGPPSDKQRDYAQALARGIFGDDAWVDEVNALLTEHFSPTNNEWGTMTKGEASKVIEHLKGMKEA